MCRVGVRSRKVQGLTPCGIVTRGHIAWVLLLLQACEQIDHRTLRMDRLRRQSCRLWWEDRGGRAQSHGAVREGACADTASFVGATTRRRQQPTSQRTTTATAAPCGCGVHDGAPSRVGLAALRRIVKALRAAVDAVCEELVRLGLAAARPMEVVAAAPDVGEQGGGRHLRGSHRAEEHLK
jgi:hypothetical protein